MYYIEFFYSILNYVTVLITYIIKYKFYKNFLGIKVSEKIFMLSILFIFILDLSCNVYDQLFISPAYLKIIETVILYCLSFTILFLCCKSDLLLKISALLVENLVLLLITLIFLPINFYLIPYWHNIIKSETLNMFLDIFCDIANTSFELVILYFFLKALCSYLGYKQPRNRSQSVIFFIPCASTFGIAQLFCYSQQFTLNKTTYFLPYILSETFYLLVPFISILLGLSILITAYNLRNIILFQEEKQKNVLIEHQYELQINHTKNLERLYNSIRKFQHDIKNHIICLTSLADNNNISEIKSYLSNLTETSNSLNFKIKTGNSISDSIINEKYNIASSENINFTCDFMIPQNTIIDSVDLCALLSNTLDNAIEACEKITSNNIEKNLTIKSYIRDSYLIIEVINTKEQPLKYKDDVIVTTKSNASAHGFGLVTINEIASKYSGIVDIIDEKNLFTISIMLKAFPN